jgi:putative pyruvate formate lyase activating enzyme
MLERYGAILRGEKKSAYLENKGNTKKLRTAVENILCSCHLCEHRCGVNRSEEAGACGVHQTCVDSHFLHYGEESILVPSYTIFLSGCNFRCVYCQNWELSQLLSGLPLPPQLLAECMERNQHVAKNVNWVGGDPTPHVLYILRVLAVCEVSLPQIWNSNMYCTPELMDILKSIIDVYLTDFKYGSNECAHRLSGISQYWEVVTRNHEIAGRQGDLIIRHLVLPNHIECCTKPVIDWIADNLPASPVNIMDQYHPAYKACTFPEIARSASVDEYRKAVTYARRRGVVLI